MGVRWAGSICDSTTYAGAFGGCVGGLDPWAGEVDFFAENTPHFERIEVDDEEDTIEAEKGDARKSKEYGTRSVDSSHTLIRYVLMQPRDESCAHSRSSKLEDNHFWSLLACENGPWACRCPCCWSHLPRDAKLLQRVWSCDNEALSTRLSAFAADHDQHGAIGRAWILCVLGVKRRHPIFGGSVGRTRPHVSAPHQTHTWGMHGRQARQSQPCLSVRARSINTTTDFPIRPQLFPDYHLHSHQVIQHLQVTMAAPEAHQTRILLDDNSFDDELTRSLFNVLKATLEYPASRCAKARKLVIDMLYFCVASDDDAANFFDIWHVFFDIISYIPPDHEWQLCLGDALDILRQDLDRYIGSDSTLFTPEEKETLSSAEWLPELKMATVVYWNGFASMFLSSVFTLSDNFFD